MSKIATDISQSKKLAKILPLESADMMWNNSSIRGVDYVDAFHLDTAPYKDIVDTSWVKSHKSINPMFEVVPAWSLSALLKVIKEYTLQTIADRSVFIVSEVGFFDSVQSELYDEPIDACVEMIEKLKERNLL